MPAKRSFCAQIDDHLYAREDPMFLDKACQFLSFSELAGGCRGVRQQEFTLNVITWLNVPNRSTQTFTNTVPGLYATLLCRTDHAKVTSFLSMHQQPEYQEICLWQRSLTSECLSSYFADNFPRLIFGTIQSLSV
jgi:hypothetical protein